MFVHLFDKIYAVDEKSEPEAYPFFYHIALKEYVSPFPFMDRYYETLISSIKNRFKITPTAYLLIIPNDIWPSFIADYCNYLGLFETDYLTMCKYSELCTSYLDNCAEEVSKNNPSIPIASSYFKNGASFIVDHFEWYPAEYAVNCLDKSWARDKFRYFQIYELYQTIKDRQFEYMRYGMPIPEILSQFKNSDQSGKLLKDSVLRKSVCDFLRIPFEYSLDTYVENYGTLGYDRYTGYKFNWYLARVLKERGYRIDSRLEST